MVAKWNLHVQKQSISEYHQLLKDNSRGMYCSHTLHQTLLGSIWLTIG